MNILEVLSIINLFILKLVNCQDENMTAFWDSSFEKDYISSENFKDCKFRVSATKVSCLEDICKIWQIEPEDIMLKPYPTTREKCCAIWEIRYCVYKKYTYDCLVSEDYSSYWESAAQQYANNGCLKFNSTSLCNHGIIYQVQSYYLSLLILISTVLAHFKVFIH